MLTLGIFARGLVMKEQEGFPRRSIRAPRKMWNWVAGTVIVALLLVNAIGLANKITGMNLTSVAGLGFPTSGLNDNVPPTRSR
jgi:hypothetical protein